MRGLEQMDWKVVLVRESDFQGGAIPHVARSQLCSGSVQRWRENITEGTDVGELCSQVSLRSTTGTFNCLGWKTQRKRLKPSVTTGVRMNGWMV